MAVDTPDSGKDLDEYEKFLEEMTKFLHEGRRAGAKRSTWQVILTSSGDCRVQAMTTTRSSARCMGLDVGRVVRLTQVVFRY